MENNLLYTKKNLVSNVKLIIDETAPLVSNLSNISRVIYESMTDTSWCGFYLADEVNIILHLAPFQ
jgi:putative methionine-R-sulfoxide reductase with GAF domain